MYPGSSGVRSKGGVNSRASPGSGRIRWSVTEAMAARARAGSAAPERTAQDCAMLSMRHSSARGRAEQGAIIECAAPIPFTVPARPVRWPARTALGMGAPAGGAGGVAGVGQRRHHRRSWRSTASRARRWCPVRLRRRGSSRRSSRRCRSAACRSRRSAQWPDRARGRNVRTGVAVVVRKSAAGRSRHAPLAARAGPAGTATASSRIAASPVTLM